MGHSRACPCDTTTCTLGCVRPHVRCNASDPRARSPQMHTATWTPPQECVRTAVPCYLARVTPQPTAGRGASCSYDGVGVPVIRFEALIPTAACAASPRAAQKRPQVLHANSPPKLDTQFFDFTDRQGLSINPLPGCLHAPLPIPTIHHAHYHVAHTPAQGRRRQWAATKTSPHVHCASSAEAQSPAPSAACSRKAAVTLPYSPAAVRIPLGPCTTARLVA